MRQKNEVFVINKYRVILQERAGGGGLFETSERKLPERVRGVRIQKDQKERRQKWVN